MPAQFQSENMHSTEAEFYLHMYSLNFCVTAQVDFNLVVGVMMCRDTSSIREKPGLCMSWIAVETQ